MLSGSLPKYIKPSRLIFKALKNKSYYPTFAAYGAATFLLTIYVCDWKRFGRVIPIWNKRFDDDEE